MITCERCDHEHTPELARSLITAFEAAELLGFEPDGQNRICSPAQPDHHRNNLALYEGDGGAHDFFTGEGGDVIWFVQYMTGKTFSQALTAIIHKALKAGREPGDVEKQSVRQVMDFTEALEKEIGDKYFRVYETINNPWEDLNHPRNCLWDWMPDTLLIPHQDQDGVYGVKVRHSNGRKEAWPGSQFTKRLYDPRGWPTWAHVPPGDSCVVAEGESDCWALDSALVSTVVYALPSGASCWKDHWLKDLEPFDKVWLCMDNDAAGKAARDKLARKIGHLRVEHLRVPDLFNDAREAIQAGWRPEL